MTTPDTPYTQRESLTTKELAEARKADAEVELAKAEAEAALIKAKAEAARNNAETRQRTIEAEKTQIYLDQERRKEAEFLAANKYHYVHTFNGVVTETSANICIEQLTTWVRTCPSDKKCCINIIFHSPGGVIVPGFALFDYIKYLQSEGHIVNTTALGMAASMAGILLQAGNERIMGREAWVLIHEASFLTAGKIGEVEDTVDWVKRIGKRILNIFASRSNMTARQIGAKWKRKDWWLSSEECLKLGFIDRIL